MTPSFHPILDRLDQLDADYHGALLNDTMPFWLPRSLDMEYGGFLCARDRDGTLLDTDKGLWQQARFTWTLGKLYNTVEQRPEWLDAARSGLDFIAKHGFDPVDGRMWFQVTRDGRPIRKRRYSFSEAFASIAWGQYYKATGDDESNSRARACFEQFVSHSRNPVGVEPKFTDTRPLKGIGFPMIGIAVAQELRESAVLTDTEANTFIDECIGEIERDFVKEDLEVVMESVTPDGGISDHFDGRMLNPGHAIEGAWFMLQEGRYRNHAPYIALGCKMLDWMWKRGWDKEFGGMLYFVDLNGGPVQEYWHDMKFWWPQNETVIATLLAWHLTREDRFATMHQQIHDWAYTHFPDPEHGEWYGYLHRDGRISSSLKGNLWKSPFHMPRMQLVCGHILHDIRSQHPAKA